MSPAELTAALKAEAHRLGFDLAGVCPAGPAPGYERFLSWLEQGKHGEMEYLASRAAAYEHGQQVLAGAKSALMLALNYRVAEEPSAPGRGRVSRYAWGTDYHTVLKERTGKLIEFLHGIHPDAQARGVVDTAPILEREFAQWAGLGWIGKNTLLLNRRLGSWFFLAAMLTDVELIPDPPHQHDHCGTCRACLDACPTQAFTDEYVLDARKCISYLTIELRTPIPAELRTGVGDWLFGCDVCQDVCPWNRKAPLTDEPAFQPSEGLQDIDPAEWFSLDEAEFRGRFRHSPLWRSKRRGLLRNAAIVLGNQLAPASIPALVIGLHDHEPLVRGACVWALRRFNTQAARAALVERAAIENDPEVLSEIGAAVSVDTQVSGE